MTKYLNGRVSGIEIFQQAEVLSIDHALLLSDGILVLNPLVYSDRFRTGHSFFEVPSVVPACGRVVCEFGFNTNIQDGDCGKAITHCFEA